MTYAYMPTNGEMKLRLTLNQANDITRAYGGTDADRAAGECYKEVYEVPSPPCSLTLATVPVLIGDQAVYQIIPLSDADCAVLQRTALQEQIKTGGKVFTLTDTAVDPKAPVKAEQQEQQRISAFKALRNTLDVDLPSFDPTLTAHPAAEAKYAKSLADQEAQNLADESVRVSDGNPPRYTATEVSDMQARVTANTAIAEGTSTGTTQVPTNGAPRGDVALQGEVVQKALMEEVAFDVAGQTYYMPQVTLDSVPEGLDTTLLYAVLYLEDGTYLTWTPFAQQPDGTWVSATGAAYTASARTSSQTWQVAVANGHYTYEISRDTLIGGIDSTPEIRFDAEGGEAPGTGGGGGSEWVDTGVTTTSQMGGGVYGVTNSSDFVADDLLRIGGSETTFVREHAPGVIIVTPDVGPQNGSVIERFQ